MPSTVTMPLYMRIGGGAEVHVGDFELPVGDNGTLTLRRTELAAALHSAADAIADPSADAIADPSADAIADPSADGSERNDRGGR